MSISTVIVNLNQAEKLKKCFESLKSFADEIIIVDLGSADKSLKVADEFNVKIIKHKFEPYVEKVRNFAVSKATGDWILVLDPDEMLGEKIKEELKKVADENKYDAVNIARKNIFFGRWIAHTNWWPDKHIRFFKKGHCVWSGKIHEYPTVKGRILDLGADCEKAIIHYGYTSVSEFMDRQNRYSDIEAENLFGNGVKFSWILFFWKPVREFLVRYIKHAGFMDGFYGLALTVLMMIYQFQVMIKLWELNRNKT